MGGALSYNEQEQLISILSNRSPSLLHDPDFPEVYIGDLQVTPSEKGSLVSGSILWDDAQSIRSLDDRGVTFSGMIVFYDDHKTVIGKANFMHSFNRTTATRIQHFEVPTEAVIPEYTNYKLAGGYILAPNEIDKPPIPSVSINGSADSNVEVEIGTYCWFSCIDKAGISQLLSDNAPLEVASGALIPLTFKGNNKPTSVLAASIHDQQMIPIKLDNGTFSVPTERGTYYYAFSAKWSGSDGWGGDAEYGLVIKVV